MINLQEMYVCDVSPVAPVPHCRIQAPTHLADTPLGCGWGFGGGGVAGGGKGGGGDADGVFVPILFECVQEFAAQAFGAQKARGSAGPASLGDMGRLVEQMGLDQTVLQQQWSQLSVRDV